MKTITAALTLLALTGCMTEGKFEKKSIEYSCDSLIECSEDKTLEFLGFSDVDSCVTEFEKAADDADDVECDFDGGAASDCLKELKDASCDADYPSVCGDVYSNCEGSGDDEKE